MSTTNKNIFDFVGVPSKRYHAKIKRLLEPLTIFCGIDRFWRNAHTADGAYSLIGNYPPAAEVFFGENLYQGHPYFRNPIFFRSGYTLPDLLHNKSYEDTQGKFREKGDCHHVLLLIQKHDMGFVEYGFATTKSQSGFEMNYLNHLATLKKFATYFDTEADDILRQSRLEYQINIAEIIGSSYHKKPDIACDTILRDKELLFLSTIEKDLELGKAILSLTKNERLTAKLYLSGNTAKEIAKKLYRSPRTVETHLAHIKSKLGITTRSKLFDVLQPYKELI